MKANEQIRGFFDVVLDFLVKKVKKQRKRAREIFELILFYHNEVVEKPKYSCSNCHRYTDDLLDVDIVDNDVNRRIPFHWCEQEYFCEQPLPIKTVQMCKYCRDRK